MREPRREQVVCDDGTVYTLVTYPVSRMCVLNGQTGEIEELPPDHPDHTAFNESFHRSVVRMLKKGQI